MRSPLRYRYLWSGFQFPWRKWAWRSKRCDRRPRTLALVIETLETRAVPSFIAPVNYDVGPGITDLAIADVTGSGIPDLVTLNSTAPRATPSLSVMLGNGDGTFQPAVFTPGVEPGSSSLVVADFTGKGRSDVMARVPDGNLAVFLSNGDGTFQPPLEVPNSPSEFAVGDLNGDGIPDLAVAGSTVQVLLGRGDGTFQMFASYPLPANGAAAVSVAIADFTGDGIPDILVSDRINLRPPPPPGLDLYVGNGDGTFQSGRRTEDPIAGGTRIEAVDLNNDGVADLIIPHGAQVGIKLNNGDGTFQDPVFYNGGAVVADVNGDGYPDLLEPVQYHGVVRVLLNNGDGTFHAGPDLVVGQDMLSLGVMVFGDFNGDGVLDVAGVIESSTLAVGTSVGVRLGNSDGTFTLTPTYPTGQLPWKAVVGDFNNDGIPDLAWTNSDPNGAVSVLLGNGDGTFQPPVTFATDPNPASVAVGDFTGDGTLDLAVITDAGVDILLGTGAGTFQPARLYAAGINPADVAVADLTGDGRLDLVVANVGDDPDLNGSISILLGNGDGTFQAARNIALPNSPCAVAVGDFNGDRRPDIAVVNHLSNQVTILLGNGDGTFQSPRSYAVGQSPRQIVVGDLTGQGRDDLAVTNGGDSSSLDTVSVLLSNPDGTFGTAVNYTVGTSPDALAFVDFNQDGRLDLAVSVVEGVRLLTGNGDGTFQVGSLTYSTTALFESVSMAVGDFNQDGSPDLVVTNTNDDSFAVLLNAGDWSSGAPHQSSRQRLVSWESTLDGDFFRTESRAAAPRTDSAIGEIVPLPAPAAPLTGLRAPRLEGDLALLSVRDDPSDAFGTLARFAIRPGDDGWFEADPVAFPRLDAVFAGLART